MAPTNLHISNSRSTEAHWGTRDPAEPNIKILSNEYLSGPRADMTCKFHDVFRKIWEKYGSRNANYAGTKWSCHPHVRWGVNVGCKVTNRQAQVAWLRFNRSQEIDKIQLTTPKTACPNFFLVIATITCKSTTYNLGLFILFKVTPTAYEKTGHANFVRKSPSHQLRTSRKTFQLILAQ